MMAHLDPGQLAGNIVLHTPIRAQEVLGRANLDARDLALKEQENMRL
jgi:hypothetical protein